MVAFLASDEASFITGQDHVVGGLTNWGGGPPNVEMPKEQEKKQ